MRIVAIADLHGHLPAELPEGDALVLIGDVFPVDDHRPQTQARWLETTLLPWLSALRFATTLLVAGNHDFLFASEPSRWRKQLPDSVRYLQDETVELGGLRIHASPWVPTFGGGWPFSLSEDQLAERWALIPEDTSVLLVHGPPYGACDLVSGPAPERAGSRTLRWWIDQHQPPLVLCGHIHEAAGRSRLGRTLVANVSHVNRQYRPVNPAQVFELTREATGP